MSDPLARRGLVLRSLTAACAIGTAVYMLPLVPQYAAEGIDFSWVQVLHVAYLRGMTFGSDIVFTFGPLGFAFTRAYWPGTFAIVVVFWALLAAGLLECWAASSPRMARVAWVAWPAFLLVCAFAAVFINDAVPMAYFMLLVARVELDPPGAGRLAIHGAAVGSIALTKVTFIFLGGLAVAAIGLVLWFGGRRREAAVVPLAAIAAFVAGWLALSQPLAGLPQYLHMAWLVAAAYDEAMSVPGPRWEIAIYVVLASGMLLTAIAVLREQRGRSAGIASVAYVLVLLAFAGKHAFTRHDDHAYIAFTFLVFASLALAPRETSASRGTAALSMAWVLSSAALLGYVTHVRTAGKLDEVAQTMLARPAQALRNLRDAAAGSAPWRAAHEQALARLRGLYAVPTLNGTVDVYSYDQWVLFANGLRWQPRPVFQSYAAYTAELAELNRRHLSGEDAPQHLLVRIQPIDGRLPALEDGASWIPMLERYALRDDRGFAILDRQPRAAPAVLERLAPWSGSGWRELADESLLLASLTTDGPGAREIQLRTADGRVHAFRFLPSVASVPFVLSPLVESDLDFASLFAPCKRGSGPPAVTAVRITTAGGSDVPYGLELQAVRELPRFDPPALSAPRANACLLKLVSGPEALKRQPIITDGEHRGLLALPPSRFAFAMAVSRARVCTRLAAAALARGGSDGYELFLQRAGEASPAARLRVTPGMLGGEREACIEAEFGRPVPDVELRVEPGAHGLWDWVYITRVETDE
jgi:hypothetical protein